MTRIAIIGAGIAGLSVAYRVGQRAPATDVTIFERSAQPGGRIATYRDDDLCVDYGANYVKSSSESVSQLITDELSSDGLIDIVEPVHTFDRLGTIAPGNKTAEHKWSYRGGLDELPQRLLKASGAQLKTLTAIVELEHTASGWSLTDTNDERNGPFESIVLTPTAAQLSRLLLASKIEPSLQQALTNGLDKIQYRQVTCAMLRYPFGLAVPFYGLVNTDKDHAIGWVSREECKSAHVPTGESVLVVQMNDEWSRVHHEQSESELVNAITSQLEELFTDERLTRPSWFGTYQWERALPTSNLDPSLPPACAEEDMWLAGDYVTGEPRIHSTIDHAFTVADQLTSAE